MRRSATPFGKRHPGLIPSLLLSLSLAGMLVAASLQGKWDVAHAGHCGAGTDLGGTGVGAIGSVFFTVSIAASPTSVTADGITTSTLISQVLQVPGSTPAPNSSVMFTTTLGTVTAGATSSTATPSTLGAASATTDATGAAVATLKSITPGVATVDAVLKDTLGNPVACPQTSVTFTALPAPATIGKISGDGQIGLAGAVLPQPLVAVVKTSTGSPLAGVSVTYTMSAPSGATGQSLSVASSTTDALGQVQTTLTLGSATGTYTVTATCSACATTKTASFTANVAAAASVAVVSGSGQYGPVSTMLTRPLVVTALSAGGVGVPGVTVAFTADKGTLTPTSITTDPNGLAATTLTLGTAGLHTVTATCSACVTVRAVTLTATALTVFPLTGTVKGVDILGTALSPAGIAGASVVLTQDQFGLTFMATSGATGTFSVNMAAGDGVVTVTRAGFDSLGDLVVVMGSDGVQSPAAANTILTMVQAAATISGTVQRSDGTGISGALVSAIEVSATTGAVVSGGRVVSALASTTGAYTLRVPTSTAWKITASTADLGERELSGTVTVPCSPTSTATCDASGNPIGRNIVYPLFATLTGTVKLDGAALLGANISAIGTGTAPNAGQTVTTASGAYTFSLAVPPSGTTHTYIVYVQTATAGDLVPRLVKVNSSGLCLNASDAVVPCVLDFTAFTSTITVNFTNSAGSAFAVGPTFMSAVASTTLGGESISAPGNAVATGGGSSVALRVVSGDSSAGVSSVSYSVRVTVEGHGELISTTVTVPGNQTLTRVIPTPSVVSGTVLQETATGGTTAAVGATVIAVGASFTGSATTSATGGYSITVPPGVSTLFISVGKTGFGTASQTLTLTGSVSGVNFTLPLLLATVSGVASGPPVNVPVTVILKSSNGTSYGAVRGVKLTEPNCPTSLASNPTAWCLSVPNGSYTASAYADGYKTSNVTVSPVVVAGGASVSNVNIAMTPIPTQPPTSAQCLDTQRCRVEAEIPNGKVIVVIPANAAGTSGTGITVTIKPTTDAPETGSFRPAVKDAGGNALAFDITVTSSTGVRVRNFASPITVRIEGQAATGLVASFDPTSTEWLGTTFTRDGNSVTFTTTHLTEFTVVTVIQSAVVTPIGVGGGGGGAGITPAPPPAPEPVSQPVGASGGAVAVGGGSTADGGLSVTIPAGAFAATVNVAVAVTNAPPTGVSAPAGTVFLNKTIDITPSVLTALLQPATVTINLTSADLNGTAISSVQVVRVNPDGTVDTLPTRVVDAAQLVIEVTVDHFTRFALVAETRLSPTITQPADGAKLTELGATLRWTNPANTTWFQVQVVPFNNDGSAINLIIGDTTLVAAAQYLVATPSFGAANGNYVMLPGMTYVWRVRTASSQTPPSESDWSAWDVRAFQTPGASSATISLQEPATGATVATVATNRPTLRWSDSNTQVFYYEVQVSKDRNFGTGPGAPFLYWEFIHGGAATPLNSYTIPSRYPLEGKATYYWRVRPRIQGDGKPVDWSVVRSFRTP